MEMINVLKRLAELDEQNSNIVNEEVDAKKVRMLTNKLEAGEITYDEFRNQLDELEADSEYTDTSMRQGEMGTYGGDTPSGNRSWDKEKNEWDDYDNNTYEDLEETLETEMDECGDMVSQQPHTPASISITAGSGEELGNMLKAIVNLAGIDKQGPDELGTSKDDVVMRAEPSVGIPSHDHEPNVMRSMVDKLNDFDDEELTDSKKNAKVDPDSYTHKDEHDYPGYDRAVQHPYTGPGTSELDHDVTTDDPDEMSRLRDIVDKGEKTDETIDSMGNSPLPKKAFNVNQWADQSEQSGPAGGGKGRHSMNQPVSKVYKDLMREYKDFLKK